jgi:formylglycine-generating enzyme required for sulfatase activity
VYEQPAVLTRSFWISQTEVTQAQWLDVMETDQNPSPFAACGLDCPVSGITLFGILEFANRLSKKNDLMPCYQFEGCTAGGTADGLECEKAVFVGPDCTGYRLPSEAELELAIGAAADSVAGEWDFWVSCPDLLPDDCAWYMMNSEVDYPGCMMIDVTNYAVGLNPVEDMRCLGPHPVGLKNANRLGLHDGLGNVREVTGTLVLHWDDPEFRDDERHQLVDPGFHRTLWWPAGGFESLVVVAKGGAFDSRYIVSHATHDIVGRFMYAASGGSKLGGGFRLVRTAKD